MHNHKKATHRSASRVDGLERGVVPMRVLGIVRNFRFREQSDVLEYLSGFEFQDKALLVEWALEAARKTAGAFPQCTEHQRFAVALYTSNNGTDAGNYHTLLNQRLRERRLEGILPLVYLTDTAIRLMGGWRGTVYRGVTFLADLGRYQVGAVVCWAQVNSTTTDRRTATTFMYGSTDCTLFVITVIDGADIQRVSLNPNECEVLLPVCSEFEVKSVERRAPGSTEPGPALTIHLEQLPTPPLFLLSHRVVPLTGPISRAQLVECLSGPPGTVVDLREAVISHEDWDGAAAALAAIWVSGLRDSGLSEERVLGLVRKAHAITFTHLELFRCQMTDAGATTIAQHCPGLTNLRLFYCEQVTDAGVTAIAEHCTGLTDLYLSRCKQVTDAGVTAISDICTGLTKLSLYGCEQTTDSSVTAIARHCTGLTNLRLTGCEQITDAGVTAIAEHCTRLTYLCLYGCEQITDGSVTAITNCRSLTYLDLSGCQQVTDAGVTFVAQHCPGLTYLDLYGCKQVTDTGVTAIAEHCTGLTNLDLSRCKQVTNAGVTAISDNCTGLTKLSLSYCHQVTDAGIATVTQRCTGLTKLDLYGCERVTVPWRRPFLLISTTP